jgi:hypothetical protein
MSNAKKPGRPAKYGTYRCTRINCTMPIDLLALLEAEGNVSEALVRIAAAHYGLNLNVAA